MADVIYSPNMNLPVPTVSTDFGPDWANNLNSSLSILDGHDHTNGSGVAIPPSGLDINTDLPMGGNSLIQTKSVVFSPQVSLSTLDAVYVIGVDLYYNDGSGNIIRITQSGNVAGASGTITGLPSGTASASYQAGSGTFQFQSATNTPANISGATLLVSEQTASPNFISIKSPTSLAAAYNFILPTALPASTKIVQLDNAGNLSATLAVDNSTLQNSANTLAVKDLGITAAKLAADSVTTAKILDSNVTSAKIQNNPVFPGTNIGIAGGSHKLYQDGAGFNIDNDAANYLGLSYVGEGLGYRTLFAEIGNTTGVPTTRGQGFDASVRNSTGVYTISITEADSGGLNVYAVVTPITTGSIFASISATSASTIVVRMHNSSAAVADCDFFISVFCRA